MRDATSAMAGSVVETTHRPGLFSSTTLSRPQANFLHQTCIAGLVKHLSTYIGRYPFGIRTEWHRAANRGHGSRLDGSLLSTRSDE